MRDRDLYQQAKELFEQLFEEPTEFREQKLAELAPQPELRALVEELLAVHDHDRSPLRTGGDRLAVSAAASIPESIGGYRVLRRLGAGAMGVVFEAEQETPKRRVALKVVRPGLWSDEVFRRFEQESALLARLHHPGIAQVYEVGQGDGGDGPQPFFALEFVDGLDLRRFVEERRLDTASRIDLILQVCAAAQHAHDRSVVHRDLKPDNIVVTAEGHLKVLDFGIARALDHDTPSGATLTGKGQVLGTLPYMSPEQISGARVDARSDLYALGVIAYELLGGVRPLDVDGLPLTEAARIITEREPPRLGTQLPEARGDLETIVATALQKDPARRYASARNLADDLERYLRHEPILARPASALYQLRKLASRHRTATVGLLTALVAMVVTIPIITFSLLESRSAAERSASVNEWLTSVLSTAHPNSAGADTRLIDALDIAAGEVADRFGDDPEQELLVRKLLSEMYHAQSMTEKALVQVQRALTLSEGRWSDDGSDRLELEVQQLIYLGRLGHFDLVEEEAPPLLRRLRAALGGKHELVFSLRRVQGTMIHRSGDFDGAADALRQLYADVSLALGSDHELRVDCLSSFANTLLTRGRRGGDRASLEECVALVTPALPAEELVTATLRETTLLRIACDANLQLGRSAEAERLARQVVRQTEGRYAEHHEVRLDAFDLLARVLEGQGRLREAGDWALRALEGYLATEGPGSPLAIGMKVSTELLLLGAGRLDDAERLARDGLQSLPDSPARRWLDSYHRHTLARCLIAAGNHAEAAPLVDELFQLHEEDQLGVLAPVDRAALLLAFLQHFEHRGDLERAERAGLAAEEIARRADLEAGVLTEIQARLVAFYERHDREDETVAPMASPDRQVRTP